MTIRNEARFQLGPETRSTVLIDDAGHVTIDALASQTVEGEWKDSKPPTEPLPAGTQVLLLAWRKSAFSTDGVYQACRTTVKEATKEHPWNLQAALTVWEWGLLRFYLLPPELMPETPPDCVKAGLVNADPTAASQVKPWGGEEFDHHLTLLTCETYVGLDPSILVSCGDGD